MNIRAIHAGWRKFCLDQMTPEPWRNGGGVTRTIAASADPCGILWRVSVADIVQDGPFSIFQGIDRTALLIGGQRLSLREDGLQIQLQADGEAAQFPGEALLQAKLDDARPLRLRQIAPDMDHGADGSSFNCRLPAHCR